MLDTQALFNDVLAGPIYAPGKTVRLERNSALDYRQRATSAHVSVAELYHENSKLFPQMLAELTATLVRVDEVRYEFLRRRATVVRASGASTLEFDSARRELLTSIGQVSNHELFYAVEVRVVAQSLLAVHEPLSDTLQVVKHLATGEFEALRTALQITTGVKSNQSAPDLGSGPLLFVVASFARNDVLFGLRGYRRTLLEAGQVAQEVVRQAERLRLTARPLFDFIDRDVDSVMEADGIEQSALMAFSLE
jgi:hypothetical protein